MTPYPDQPLFDGIKKFQKDKGLFQDSLMVPGGETVTALNKVLGKRNGGIKPQPMAYTPRDNNTIKELEAEKRRLESEIERLLAASDKSGGTGHMLQRLVHLQRKLDKVIHHRAYA